MKKFFKFLFLVSEPFIIWSIAVVAVCGVSMLHNFGSSLFLLSNAEIIVLQISMLIIGLFVEILVINKANNVFDEVTKNENTTKI